MKRILPFLGILLILVATGCKSEKTNTVTIAAAANMQFALGEITEAFSKETGITCQTILGSSGKLNAQIKEGAPYQVFVSADMGFPENLFESGFTDSKPRIYAKGTLVLWSFDQKVSPSIDKLDLESIKHIAIPNAKTAPYGVAAIQVLEGLDSFKTIKSKLVYGESVGQTNQFIITKAAQVGVTAKSVVMSTEMKNKGNWVEVPEELHSPIYQGVVLIKNKSGVAIESQKFVEFLFSDTAQSILKKYGYRLPE